MKSLSIFLYCFLYVVFCICTCTLDIRKNVIGLLLSDVESIHHVQQCCIYKLCIKHHSLHSIQNSYPCLLKVLGNFERNLFFIICIQEVCLRTVQFTGVLQRFAQSMRAIACACLFCGIPFRCVTMSPRLIPLICVCERLATLVTTRPFEWDDRVMPICSSLSAGCMVFECSGTCVQGTIVRTICRHVGQTGFRLSHFIAHVSHMEWPHDINMFSVTLKHATQQPSIILMYSYKNGIRVCDRQSS
jgi:hypothetical protein